MADARRRPPRALIVGAIVLVFLVWGAWAWSQWGQPGQGVDDSPGTIVEPAAVPSPEPSAEPARPDNTGHDATGDAAAGDRTVTRNPS